jgi:hypothetical protein
VIPCLCDLDGDLASNHFGLPIYNQTTPLSGIVPKNFAFERDDVFATDGKT